ncbi:MAG: EamA family transporter [Goleter apudmare HA4340-LM2]|jgi:drug/metabolite transporter (DMT)-like permease|nr:EamA family transporter [Goleter apudmare HA4340-LM2]
MGRFEKQPDNPRGRGDLSRSAENALWAVVEDLENLQQHVIRSMQEEIKRLQGEKNRLTDDIQRLSEEKEQLQQVRQITEQQVLIRQLAEALAKHISSQLQSSLTTLANKALDQQSYETSALKSAEINSTSQSPNNENVEQLLGSLDDSLTITFNSLQQELKNYQSSISQQLSRMHNQQQQGEYILTELINRLQGLEKTITETSLKATKVPPPKVLQPPEEQIVKVSAPTVLQPAEPPENSTFATSSNLEELASNTVEPMSVISPDLSEQESSTEIPPLPPVKPDDTDSISVIPEDFSERENRFDWRESSTEIPPLPPVKPDDTDSISVIPEDFSERENRFDWRESSTEIPPLPPVKSDDTDSISVIPEDFSERENRFDWRESSTEIPPLPPVKPDDTDSISVIPEDFSERENRSEPIVRSRQQAAPSPSPELSSSSGLSPIQIGFLLVVLSTVLSSLYNVAIKVIFHQGSEILGIVAVERLLPPTLGNTLLILMLRLLVVVPLMLLLAPIMHPRVWEDLQNIVESVRGAPTRANAATQRVLQLSIASGCFLFLSQVLVYLAIGQIPTGMAIALFFVYPLVSGLLSWFLFRDRPSMFRTAAIGSLFCGELLVLGGANIDIGTFSLGSSTAILSGVAFAVYVILTRACASKLHPVSFTLINFATMLVLSFIGLMIPLPGEWSLVFDPSKLLEIVLSAFILGVLTLCGYVFNNVGIRKLGASRSAIIGAGVPILTVIFAGLLIQENLELIQILGVLLVTFGAAAFSFEKMRNLIKSSNSTN